MEARSGGASMGSAYRDEISRGNGDALMNTSDDARPSGASGRDTVLAAGLSAFSRWGYHGTSIRAIARESGQSLSVLYHYFDSKDALFHEIVRLSADKYFEICDDHLSKAGPRPTDRLKALIDATVEHRIERRAEARLLASEMHVLPDELRETVIAGWRRASRTWDEIIADGLESGNFTTRFPHEARRGIVAMCNATREWFYPDDETTLSDMAERLYVLSLGILSSEGETGVPSGAVAGAEGPRDGIRG